MSYDTTTVDTVLSVANKIENRFRKCMLNINDIENPAGGSAGALVDVTVEFDEPLPSYVTSYNVQVTPNQDATVFVTSKEVTGFTITLRPRLATDTLAAGTLDVLITWDAGETE